MPGIEIWVGTVYTKHNGEVGPTDTEHVGSVSATNAEHVTATTLDYKTKSFVCRP